MIFAKRSAYRDIFQNDKISFGEMQVLPLALGFINNPYLLDSIFVFDDEFVKGMINTKKNFYTDGSVAVQVKELYIDPFFQRNGIGGKLLLEIENNNKCNSVSDIYLWVLEKNKEARHFYEKYGFNPTGEKKLEEGTLEYIAKYAKKI